MRRFLSLLMIAVAPVVAQQIEVIEDGVVHEAYLTPVRGSIVLDAVVEKPPEPVLEKQPATVKDDMNWVPGYWDWSVDRDDFIWVTGVWRRPPPGHQWIPGQWKYFDEGWARLPGFWSRIDLSEIDYIAKRPPDPIAEDEEESPKDNSFWIPGYWSYDKSSDDYSWLNGRWEQLDPDWVFVPSHYTWREDGYVFIAGYWDWPIEQIGQAYNNIYVTPNQRVSVVYEPSDPLQPGVVIRRCFLYYPDYVVWYHHHYHYHTGWWSGWCCTPPWWGWSGWWGFSWQNQWGLWWWWGHPGWPQPFWLNANLAQKIGPPQQKLFNMFKGVHGPRQLTPKGMLNADQLLRDKKPPILPGNRADRERIMKQAERELKPPRKVLRPEGTSQEPGQVKRPNVRKPGDRPERGDGRVNAPPRSPTKPMRQPPPRVRPDRPEVRPPEVRPGQQTPRRPDVQSRPQPRPRPKPESRPQPQPRPRPTPESRPPPSHRPGPSRVTPQTGPRQTGPREKGPRQTAPSEIGPR